MLNFVIRRLLLAIPTVLAITAPLFFSSQRCWAAPPPMMLGENATPEAILSLNARMASTDPPTMRYVVGWPGVAR